MALKNLDKIKTTKGIQKERLYVSKKLEEISKHPELKNLREEFYLIGEIIPQICFEDKLFYRLELSKKGIMETYQNQLHIEQRRSLKETKEPYYRRLVEENFFEIAQRYDVTKKDVDKILSRLNSEF
ncbi:MAG: hypothetical protein ACOYT4_04315 [Nanoarchaeota archaeon]